jgi:hypothetical protein
MPWGNQTFGNETTDKKWGIASIPEVLGFLSPDVFPADENGNIKTTANTTFGDDDDLPLLNGYNEDGVLTNDGGFSPQNFTMILLPAEALEGQVIEPTEVTWTRTPASKVYTGSENEPTITVTMNDVTLDLDETIYTAQYTWTDPYDEEHTEVVDAPIHAGAYTVEVGIRGIDGSFAAVSASKPYTITKKQTLKIQLAQKHMKYGDDETTLLPEFGLMDFVGMDEEDDFIIDGLGYCLRGPDYIGTDLVAGTVIEYTTTGTPHAFTGRTYVPLTEEVQVGEEEQEVGGEPQMVPVYEERPVLDEYGDPVYTDEIDFIGYEDYVAVLITNNAQLIADPGQITITINEDAMFKTYGEKDPDFNAVYQNTDPTIEYSYTEEDDLLGKPVFFTATNQSGEEVDLTKDPVVITREKAAEWNEDGTLKSAEGEDVGEYKFYATTTTNYLLAPNENANKAEKISSGTPAKVTNYKWTLDDVFTIDQFDISTDIAQEAIEDDPTTEPNEAQPAKVEKFVITAPEPTYNAETQFPDPKNITFNHEVLGLMQLMFEEDGTTPIVPFVEKWKKDVSDGVYTTEYYTYTKAFSPYNYGDGTVGSYSAYNGGGVKEVYRNQTTGAVVEGAQIAVTGLGNFTGTKKQPYAMQPAKLSVKVKDNATMEYAGATPNFGIELDPDGEFTWVAKEPTANKDPETGLLKDLGDAIYEYETGSDPATAYGYIYDGSLGENKAIGGKKAAKEAVNVILAIKNYTPVYAEGTVTITAIEVAVKPVTQTLDYASFIEGNTYKPVVINSVPSLDIPAVYYTQEEIDNAAGSEDPAYGKTTEDIKTPAVPGTVQVITTADLTIADKQAIVDLYAKINQSTSKACKKEGADYVPNAGALTLVKKLKDDGSDVDDLAGYNITVQAGDLIVKPLEEMHLAYGKVDQALEDHKGFTMTKVYMPARDLKKDTWYTFVLPFDFSAPEFDKQICYEVIDVLEETMNDGNIHFNTKVGDIEANQPFLVKINASLEEENTEGGLSAAQLSALYFKNKTIADVPTKVVDEQEVPVVAGDEGYFAYNNLAYAPSRSDLSGNTVIGVYKTTEQLTANDWFLGETPNKWYCAKSTQWECWSTEAYVKTPANSAPLFFVQEADGSITAIKGIESDAKAPVKKAEGWYTVNGMKLNAAPTVKGTYIKDGKKVFVK